MLTELSVLISAMSAVVAVVSATVTVWSYRREQLNQKVSAAKWKKEYFSDLLKWSDECMSLLSEAFHLCELNPAAMTDNKFFDFKHILRIKLSAQIDRGRWFFPNYAVESYGQDKHAAFRGYRPAVLDGLVYAYQAITALSYVDASNGKEVQKRVEDAKRLFTSEVQKVLDPRSRDAEFNNLVGKVAEA